MEHKIVFSHFIYIHALMGYTTAKLLHVHIQCSTMLFKVPFISNVIIERKMAICVRVVHVLMINEHISWNTATCISFMSTYICTPLVPHFSNLAPLLWESYPEYEESK